jgi:hypothetical protein
MEKSVWAFLPIISTHEKITYNTSMKFSPMSDDFDEYPEINQANLDISIRQRNFYNRHHEYIYG